ncbi:molybdopterin-dependent oxidoreductase [Pseudotabrizicola sp. 4114]|uniref:molybdopterin-dependent oxidoreductase n=1 Tax=Pseudotabrizicola sp. 4114 TaxID=2817731 RepID=UPI00285B15AE|nr:biotin/methionine sulfoxide reductase [Pseudorhodobacter sp. 4114]
MTSDHNPEDFVTHSAHWGVFTAGWRNGQLEVRPHPGDPDPNRIIENATTGLRHTARIERPTVRKGWLDNGPGPSSRRGKEPFVPVSWEVATALVAEEVGRIRDTRGPGAIFGGSYGWASAGRFHHAQSQVHRFLNITAGGYVRSVNSYSAGASTVILPHVLADIHTIVMDSISWQQIADHTEVVLAFGGMALKNSAVAGGGISRHVERGAMQAAQARGCRFHLISPIRDDLPVEAGAAWLPIRPNTDCALMLGLMAEIVASGNHDRAFLDRFTVGWDKFEAYLTGVRDGVAKDADWAAARTGVPADVIRRLAGSLPGKRVVVGVAHSLQRADHGEQPVWMGIVLAAMLGQIGLPGGGYCDAVGSLGYYGRQRNAVRLPTLPQGENGVRDFIPVARISDMLLNPGGAYRYNGQTRQYPDIRLAFWAGGNPFHHHQDLNRLRRAFGQLDTFIVNDYAWTGTARHADIVLPCTMSLEREDIGASSHDPLLVAMKPVIGPYGEARDDYRIFADISEMMGFGDAFTEGRTAREWLEHLYDVTRTDLAAKGLPTPEFADFWRMGTLDLPQKDDDGGTISAFRANPGTAPLKTPSGKVEIFSKTIAAFDEADCLGHPAWFAPDLGQGPDTPLILIANQPARRLHSQLDYGRYSAEGKINGREVATMHPDDAAARGVAEGDMIRLHNARGACLAAVTLSDGIIPGAIRLPTGAWFDPDDIEADTATCMHGNPNVLTRDVGTSSLAQGCTGQLTSVQVERHDVPVPPIRAYNPPETTSG